LVGCGALAHSFQTADSTLTFFSDGNDFQTADNTRDTKRVASHLVIIVLCTELDTGCMIDR